MSDPQIIAICLLVTLAMIAYWLHGIESKIDILIEMKKNQR